MVGADVTVRDFKVPGMEVIQESARRSVGKTAHDCKHERISGYVHRYASDKGWGFVRSEQFDGELFFQSEELMQEYANHRVVAGERVEFTVQVDEAASVQTAVLVKPFVNRTAYDCIGNRYRGYIRRFAERWGFLNSAAFDGDLFVHRDNLLLDQDGKENAPLVAKQMVEFDVMLDERGRAVARFITTRVPSQPRDWLGMRLRGHIRSFQNRWGFLNSDRFQGDLFVHRDSIMPQFQCHVNLSPGTIAEFDVELDEHRSTKEPGCRLVARNVVVLQPADCDVPLPKDFSRVPPPRVPSWREPMLYYAPSPALPYSGDYVSPTSFPSSNWNSHIPPNAHSGFRPNIGTPRANIEWADADDERDSDEKQFHCHIAVKDWEPTDQGQLRAKKGQILTISHEVPHGWTYGAHRNHPDGTPHSYSEREREGWIPKAMVKQVTLRQAFIDWHCEGGTTLSVRKGEWIAVSREADRGWVFGDRVVSGATGVVGAGWLPKKILH